MQLNVVKYFYNYSFMNNKTLRNSGTHTFKKTSSEIICQNIGVPTQTIFQDYRCTYKEKISYFGRLYIGEEHIMFVSNMFGVVKKVAISISSIQKLEEKGSKSIQVSGSKVGYNSLEQFLFTSLETNHAIKLINAVWKKQKLQPSIINNEQEKQNYNVAHDIQHLDSSQVEINLFNASGAEKERVKMLEIVLPCSVQQFQNFFLADNALLYGRKKHLQLKKAHSIEITPWKRQEELNADTRQISAVIRVKGVPLLSEARMNQVCILTRNQKKEIDLKIITNMGDVPYHSYFNCQEHIRVNIEADHKCKYTVYAAVIFNKSTYMKNHIVTKTFEDFNEEYKMWSNNCKNFLQAKKIEYQQKMRKQGRKSIEKDVEFETTKAQIHQIELQQQRKSQQKDVLSECMGELKQIRKQLHEVKRKIKKQNIFLCICMIAMLVIGIIQLCQAEYR